MSKGSSDRTKDHERSRNEHDRIFNKDVVNVQERIQELENTSKCTDFKEKRVCRAGIKND